MPGGYKNIRPEDRTEGLEKHPENINKKGAPVSIRKQIREILNMDGTMKIKKEHVVAINEDGSIEIIMPKKDMVAMKLIQWAMSNKETASVRSIQIIMDHLEGRPAQSLNISTDEPINQVLLSDKQFLKVMKELKPKEK